MGEEIIEGEVIDNEWFLSAIKGDIDYLRKNAKKNVGKVGEGGCTAMMYASDRNNVECVSFLSEFDEEIGKQDVNGNTALMYAVKRGNIDCVELLAEYESNIFNADGKRAIDFARENRHRECEMLLSKFEEADDESSNDSDDSNDERNLIKENKKLKKKNKILNSANNTIDREAGISSTIGI